MPMQRKDNGLLFKIKVQPGASKNRVIGFSGDALKIKLTAPPEKGKANEQLIEFLAEKLQIKKASLSIIKGFKSREKIIKIQEIKEEDLRAIESRLLET